MRCTMCRSEELETKHLDVFTIGSEGTEVCYHCEMLLVEYIRAARNIAGRSKRDCLLRVKREVDRK